MRFVVCVEVELVLHQRLHGIQARVRSDMN